MFLAKKICERAFVKGKGNFCPDLLRIRMRRIKDEVNRYR